MSDIVVLVEVLVTSPAGDVATLRFADRAVRPFPPGDPDRANIAFDDRLVEAPAIRRALFEDMANLTPSLGVGAMTLANADGDLDAYEGHVWGEITARRWTTGTAFAAGTIVLRGLCGPPSYEHNSDRPARVRVNLYDYRAEVSKTLQTTLYAGTNGGGVLYEGSADGLKGQPKPLAYGRLLDAHLPGALVAPSVLGYQLHDGAIEGSEQIFDRGDAAGYVDDGDLSGSAFDAATPASAHYRTDIGRGLVKITGSPVGEMTFGCKGDATGGYVETAGPIIARILAKAGIPSGRIGATIAALDAAAPVGVYAGGSTTAQELISFLATSVPASVLPDTQGVWQAWPFAAPIDVADITIAEDQVLSLAADETAPPPAGEIRVGWGRVWTTFGGTEIAPALRGTPSEERLAAEYRWATLDDAVVKARLPGAWTKIEVVTGLRLAADAQALAARLQALFGLKSDGRPRRKWRVTIELTPEVMATRLGATVALEYPPRGISGNFLLVGDELQRPRRDQAIWTLWG